ncbi:MAG: hypothetical protein U0325_09270 [Polyangiales bacterium]
MDAAIDLPCEVYSSGVRRFVCEQLADRSVGHSCEALEQLGIEVPRRQAEQARGAHGPGLRRLLRGRERPANDAVADTTLLVLSTDAKGVRMLPRALREATRKAAARDATEVVRGDPMAARQERAHDRRMAVVTAIWDQAPCVREAREIVEQLKPPAQRTSPKRTLPRPRTSRSRRRSRRTSARRSERCLPRRSDATRSTDGRGSW